MSLIFISIIIVKVGLKAFISPYQESRPVIGAGSPTCILGLVISAYSKQYGFKIFRDNILRYIFILINLIAIYLFASRTYWLVLVIFLFMFNLKTILKYRVLFLFVFIMVILLFFVYTVKNSGKTYSSNSLMYKIVNMSSELSFKNYQTYSDINIHYRGYESYRAFKTYTDGTLLNHLFGHGYGKQIDLKVPINLGGAYRSIIPWIHNGYFFILVKEGLMGLLSLVMFFFFALKIGYRNIKNENAQKQLMSLLIISCTFSLILSNYVICSIFTIEMAIFMVTIGVLIQTLKTNDLSICNEVNKYSE